MSGTAHILIPAELRDRLKVLAAVEHTTIGKIVAELIEVRLGDRTHQRKDRDAQEIDLPWPVRGKGWAKDWKRRVQEYIGTLSAEDSFDVPDLMEHLGADQRAFSFREDWFRSMTAVKRYVETLPGLWYDGLIQGAGNYPQYYLSKDALAAARQVACDDLDQELDRLEKGGQS